MSNIRAAAGISLMHSFELPLVHRDLKTSNILLHYIRGKLVPKICDFGTAKDLQETATATVIGTAIYQSPEVWRGRIPRRVRFGETAETGIARFGKMADVFAFGIIMHEILEYKLEDKVKLLFGK